MALKTIPVDLIMNPWVQVLSVEEKGYYFAMLASFIMNSAAAVKKSSIQHFWPGGPEKLLEIFDFKGETNLFGEEDDKIVCFPLRNLRKKTQKIRKNRKKAGYAAAKARWGWEEKPIE